TRRYMMYSSTLARTISQPDSAVRARPSAVASTDRPTAPAHSPPRERRSAPRRSRPSRAGPGGVGGGPAVSPAAEPRGPAASPSGPASAPRPAPLSPAAPAGTDGEGVSAGASAGVRARPARPAIRVGPVGRSLGARRG